MLAFHRGNKVIVKPNFQRTGQKKGIVRFTIPKHKTSNAISVFGKQYIEERTYYVQFPNGTMRAYYPQRLELVQ